MKAGTFMPERTFGVKKPGVQYRERTAAYGIGFREDGKIPVIQARLFSGDISCFLLGGGLLDGEGHRGCIVRECLEEAGLSVRPTELICKGDCFHYVEQLDWDCHLIGYFYIMEIGDIVAEPIEPDKTLVWLTPREAAERLFFPHQAWAVEQACLLFGKPGGADAWL
jgi:8-oxo-dGTP diphosphatase